jgi:hypothetical protein
VTRHCCKNDVSCRTVLRLITFIIFQAHLDLTLHRLIYACDSQLKDGSDGSSL